MNKWLIVVVLVLVVVGIIAYTSSITGGSFWDLFSSKKSLSPKQIVKNVPIVRTTVSSPTSVLGKTLTPSDSNTFAVFGAVR